MILELEKALVLFELRKEAESRPGFVKKKVKMTLPNGRVVETTRWYTSQDTNSQQSLPNPKYARLPNKQLYIARAIVTRKLKAGDESVKEKLKDINQEIIRREEKAQGNR